MSLRLTAPAVMALLTLRLCAASTCSVLSAVPPPLAAGAAPLTPLALGVLGGLDCTPRPARPPRAPRPRDAPPWYLSSLVSYLPLPPGLCSVELCAAAGRCWLGANFACFHCLRRLKVDAGGIPGANVCAEPPGLWSGFVVCRHSLLPSPGMHASPKK